MLRYGACYQPDPNAVLPAPFVYEVGAPDMEVETWRQGTVLIKNPKALHPLPDEWFGAAAEEDLVDGKSVTKFREPFHPYWSMTKMFGGNPPTLMLQMESEAIWEQLTKVFPV